MRKTDVRVHGKSYQVICADDQVDHVRQLGEEVDARAGPDSRRYSACQ